MGNDGYYADARQSAPPAGGNPVIALTLANLRMMLRNRQGLFWALFFPLLLVVVFGLFDFSGFNRPEVLALNQAGGAASGRLLERLAAVELLDLRLEEPGAAAADTRELLESGELDYLLVIPAGFDAPDGPRSPEFQPAALVYATRDPQRNQLVDAALRTLAANALADISTDGGAADASPGAAISSDAGRSAATPGVSAGMTAAASPGASAGLAAAPSPGVSPGLAAAPSPSVSAGIASASPSASAGVTAAASGASAGIAAAASGASAGMAAAPGASPSVAAALPPGGPAGGRGVAPWEAVRTEVIDTPAVDYFDSVLLGLLCVGIMTNSIISIAVRISTYRNQAILKRLLAAPLPVWKFFAGEILAHLLLALVQAGIILAVGVFVFGGSLHGGLGGTLLITLLGTLVFLNIGFILSAWANSPAAASGMGNAIALPMMFFAGAFFSTGALPWLLPYAALALPLTPMLQALREVALNGAALWETWPLLAALGGWALATGLAAVRLFRFN